MSFLCSIPLAASLFSACAPAAPLAVGYVEGDYVLLAPIEVAQVETVAVKRGDRVEAGDAGRRAGKRRRQDRRRAGRGGARPGAGAARRSARSASGRKRSPCSRRRCARPRRRPTKPGACSTRVQRPVQARHRHAGASSTRPRPRVEVAEAQIGQAEANLAVGRPAGAAGDDQGGRKPGQAGAGGARAGAMAAVQARAGGARRPAASTTSSAIPATSPGPSAPVISMLPDGAVKLTLYRAGKRVLLGRRSATLLDVRCDGCAAGPDGARQLCLARSGIHPAGDLLARDPAEARLPRRGAAGRRCTRAAAGPDRRCAMLADSGTA